MTNSSALLLPLITIFLVGTASFPGTSVAVSQDVVETKNGTIPSFSVTYDTVLSKGDSIKLIVEDSEDCSVTSGSVKPSSDDGWTKGAKNEYMATIPENYSGKHIGRFGGRMNCEGGGGGNGSGKADPPSWSGVARTDLQSRVVVREVKLADTYRHPRDEINPTNLQQAPMPNTDRRVDKRDYHDERTFVDGDTTPNQRNFDRSSRVITHHYDWGVLRVEYN